MASRKRTPFTPLHVNMLEFIKESMDRAVNQHVAICRRRALHKMSRWQLDVTYCGTDVTSALERVFTWFASRKNPPGSFEDVPNDIEQLLETCLSMTYTGLQLAESLEKIFLADLHKHATRYELMSAMPRAKRERKARPVLSDVEQRSLSVDDRIRDWERKLKYAKTRLAKLRRKQKYYAKKGAVV